MRELVQVQTSSREQLIAAEREREGERIHSNYHKYTAKNSTAAYIKVVVVVIVDVAT